MSKSFNFNLLGNDVDLEDLTTNGIIFNKEKERKTESPVPETKKQIKPNQKTIKKKQEKQSLQALAFGNGKGKKKVAASVTSVKAPSTSQQPKKTNKNDKALCNGVKQSVTEDWKNRDQQYMEEQLEKQLREALLLSKLEYEQNKELYDKQMEEANKNKPKKKKKEKSTVTLSLSEFHNTNTDKLLSKTTNEADPKNKVNNNCQDFFKDVDKMVQSAIIKENRLKQFKEQAENSEKEKIRKASANNKNSSPAKQGPVMVPISALETRDFEIQALRLEVENLKKNLDDVKSRNKKLCEMLGTIEMRSRGEMVLELEKVTKSRDEFSAEVATLSEQLEQEKTKVSLLQNKARKK